MKTIGVCARLALAAAVCPALGRPARADEPLLSDDALPATLQWHVYINAFTGERTTTPTGPSRLSDLFWQNDDIGGSCNFFFGQDRPTRDTLATGRVRFSSAVAHWGDVPTGSFVDGYEVAYAANIGCDTAHLGVAGLDMINAFLENYDGVMDPGGSRARTVIAFILEDIVGGDCTMCTNCFPGGIYTIDLEGSGHEFEFGADDLDADGRPDVGYSYEFVQGQDGPKGIIGPYLVRPASLGGRGSAFGCPDSFDWFNQFDGPSTFSHYVGSFWFGGGDCAVPRPYASLYIDLFGSSDVPLCRRIDYTHDGLVDFADFLQFLNNFDAQHPAADLNDDGLVDFADYLEFLNLYDACAA